VTPAVIPDFWLRVHNAHDLWHAEHELDSADAVKAMPTLHAT
jgi:hypothetical protein